MKIDVIVSRHRAAVEFVASQIGGHVSPDGTTVIVDTLLSGERTAREDEAQDLGTEYHGGYTYIPVLASASPDDVRRKRVAGNLPLHLAAVAEEVHVVEFSGDAPRGREYTLADMTAAGARLVSYVVLPAAAETLHANYECGGYPGTVLERARGLAGLPV